MTDTAQESEEITTTARALMLLVVLVFWFGVAVGAGLTSALWMLTRK